MCCSLPLLFVIIIKVVKFDHFKQSGGEIGRHTIRRDGKGNSK